MRGVDERAVGRMGKGWAQRRPFAIVLFQQNRTSCYLFTYASGDVLTHMHLKCDARLSEMGGARGGGGTSMCHNISWRFKI